MSRIITGVALFCLAIAVGMAVLKWNNSTPTAENPMLNPQNTMSVPAQTPGQPVVIEQGLPANGMPTGAGVPNNNSLAPAPVLTSEHPSYATMPPAEQMNATGQPEKVIVEKRLVYVRPRNRIHIGRTLYETAHYVFNLPNRILGP